ncbi:sodium:solute symporter family transporter [Serratia marcescens]|uniref:sodium:solute symporter family transporter n=1 Tax=Serratia marcescens TaxID=615 RepID=UPI001A1E61E0|nr:sodium:solute symporter [Serratia marcescens]
MNLDLLVVVFYFLVIGAVGWMGIRRANSKEAYLVAGRNLGPGLYLGTLSAVVLGGASTIGSVKLGYTYGISGVWLCGALGLGIVVLSLVLAKPLLKLKLYTVSQVLSRRYHPAARVTSGAIMLAYDLMVAVTSIIAIGSVMQVMFGLSFSASILLGGGLVVLYSTLGGMWSLTLTDIIQFIIMTVGMMLVLMPMSIVKAGGWEAFTSLLPAGYYQLSSIGLDTILVFFLIYFFGILIGQDIWQRVFTARSANVARFAGLMSTASACLLASSTIALEDVLPAIRRKPSGGLAAGRFTTLLMGAVMLGLAFVVRDVLAALTLAYNLLVGGMLIPLVGAIFWPRATSAGAIASMLTGSLCVVGLMVWHGIDANSPIYGGLLGGGVAFVLGSLLSRPAAQLQTQTER